MSSNIFEEDNYLPCEVYENQPHQEDGFSRFFHEENGQWYFGYFRNNHVFLRSEGYSNEPARENGIVSVQKNFGEAANYKVSETLSGQWVLCLRAANNKEIACSCPYPTEAEAKKHLPGNEVVAHEDDYLACADYEGHPPLPDHPHMAKFSHGDDFLFVVYDELGKVRLRSEKYSTETARDKGFDSVIKNQHEDAHYKIEEKSNHFFVVLKAANHQEIARSCPFTTETDARKILPSAIKKMHHDDDYLPCKAYEGHEADSKTRMAKFSTAGEFLFVVYGEDNKVLLRSERYPSEQARDKGYDSVLNNREKEERYIIEEKINHYFLVLRAGNNHEIARSCPFDSKSQAAYFLPSAVAKRGTKETKTHKEDNYLACTHYESRVRTVENPEFCTFIHNELYYFALLDYHGDVLLRSEGYSSAAARDNGIESVITNRSIRDRYHVIDWHGAYFVKLMAGNQKEIARSCPSNEEDALALITLLTTASEEVAEPLTATADVSPVTDASGKFNWWFLILPLFAIIVGMLWWRSCSSTTADNYAGMSCELQPILFEFDSDEIPSTGNIELREMAELMNENPTFTARIEAFTDSIGTFAYNQELSRRRCEAARDVLTAAGIASSRINIDPEAYLEPIAKNTTDDSGRHFNRRVELMVFDAEGNTVCKREKLDIPESLRLD